MLSAALARLEPKAARGIDVAGRGAAKMNNRGELLLLRKSRRDAAPLEDSGHAPVEVCRGELDRVPREHARIERVEPAVLAHRMAAHAIALRLGESAVGHLEKSHCARSRPIDLARISGHAQAPRRGGD